MKSTLVVLMCATLPWAIALPVRAAGTVSRPPPAVAPAKARAAPVHPASATHAVTLATIQVKATAGAAPRASSVGPYGDASLHDTPAAVTVLGRGELDDAGVQSLAELTRLDPALGDGYAPIGYIQNLTVRGYPLDLATGYRINDLTVTGEQYIPFENVQQVEVLQGLAGIDAGVMEPGGVVNYVTRRPADVRTVRLGTDAYGSRYAALDWGHWLTPHFGLRVNIASEAMHATVDHTHGHRHFYSLAADWHLAPHVVLMLDSEFQGYAQHSVSAYQLLGGTALPQAVDRHQLLGYEQWGQPTTVSASNTSARLNVTLAPGWTAHAALGHSRSYVLDNVAFAYGCAGSPDCVPGPTPAAWFAPNGDYAVWDFRSPDETYVDDEARATVSGQLGGGWLHQDLTFGVDVLHHTVALPGEVFDYVGTANIAQRVPPFFPPSPATPGPVIPRLDSWQRSALALDRVHLGAHWQVLAGGHLTRLTQRSWDSDGNAQPGVRRVQFLPQAALMWLPTPALTAYLSYSKGLALGQQAPYWAANAGDTLAPRLSRQMEAGLKYRRDARLTLTAALYRIREPYQFAAPAAAPGTFTFVQRGEDVHAGLELTAQGHLTDNLRLDAGVAWIRARAENTGVAAFEGHQTLNVPRLRGTLTLGYGLPAIRGLTLLAGWQYASPNVASADGTVRVPAYNVFDAGLRYVGHLGRHRVVSRLLVSNVFDRFYWRYTGSDGNDSYLLPGAPRVARLSVSVDL
ncbi:MAG: TonB-dependent siderophore receptor [Rhodanobacteraceae bacterium]|nr:MAG: TonB-dependent siderophore receptor [Rhodanobacteraceae bacterium]